MHRVRVYRLEGVADTETDAPRAPGEAVDEVEARTIIQRELQMEREGVFQSDLGGHTGIDAEFVLFVLVHAYITARSEVEVEGTEGADVEVIDGYDIEGVVEKSEVSLEEAGAEGVLIRQLGAVGGTETDGLGLCNGHCSKAQGCSDNGNDFLHV